MIHHNAINVNRFMPQCLLNYNLSDDQFTLRLPSSILLTACSALFMAHMETGYRTRTKFALNDSKPKAHLYKWELSATKI
ncbi:MAG: hypothetical protein K0R78_1657 [Pelosinus sp.]|jgi:hypothetical protein|nr:hypothetical protein [Pelosinus sp.]